MFLVKEGFDFDMKNILWILIYDLLFEFKLNDVYGEYFELI